MKKKKKDDLLRGLVKEKLAFHNFFFRSFAGKVWAAGMEESCARDQTSSRMVNDSYCHAKSLFAREISTLGGIIRF